MSILERLLEEIIDILDDGLLSALIIITVILFAWVAVEIHRDNKAWEIFKAQHHCRIVAQISGSVFPGTSVGVATNGSVGVVSTINTEPDKIGWLCDDGVTYYR